VLEARDGREAIAKAEKHAGRIHLLLTDVVMPHMSGREVAQRLALTRPDTRVLFMSGHADEAVARHGVLADGAAFLQKPIMPRMLTLKVREILDSGLARSGT
jgi:YesN/AraC family two-component response regulator